MTKVVKSVDRYLEAIKAKQSILCMGCDPQIDRLPRHLFDIFLRQCTDPFEAVARAVAAFYQDEIDAVCDIVPWVKPQSAFFEQLGPWGMWALEQIIAHASKRGLIVILDAKRCDGGDTARAYAQAYLGSVTLPFMAKMPFVTRPSPLRAEAVTIQPYIGTDGVMPFVEAGRQSGGMPIVVVKTSFKRPDVPCSEVEMLMLAEGIPAWQAVAKLVDQWSRGTEGECGLRNVGAVMGATFPEDVPTMRAILPYNWLLVPGFGSQGGGADDAVLGALTSGFGITVNSSRDLNYAFSNQKRPDFTGDPRGFAECCRNAALHDRYQLNVALRRAGKGDGFLLAT